MQNDQPLSEVAQDGGQGARSPYAPPRSSAAATPAPEAPQGEGYKVAAQRLAGMATGLRISGVVVLGCAGFLGLATVLNGLDSSAMELALLGGWGLSCSLVGGGVVRGRRWARPAALAPGLIPLALFLILLVSMGGGGPSVLYACLLGPVVVSNAYTKLSALYGGGSTDVFEYARSGWRLNFFYNGYAIPDLLIALLILAATYFTAALAITYG